MNQHVSQVPKYHYSHRAPLYFLFLSVLCQTIAIGVFLMAQNFLMQPWLLVVVQSGTAFALARWLKLSLPWQIFNLLLVPGIIACTSLDLPREALIVALILVVLLYLPTFWTRVPYYPTSEKMYARIAAMLPDNERVRFIDLGCGFGSLLEYLARSKPSAHLEGIELSPLAYLVTKLRFMVKHYPQVSISLGNFWSLSLEPYDIVYAFLSPTPMPYLWEKVRQEMRPGTLFVSNTFPVPASASEEIKVDESYQGTLYVYRLGGK